MYVGIDQELVDRANFEFKSDKIGAGQILVYPEHPKFRCGLWRIAVDCSAGDSLDQKVGLRVELKEAKNITVLKPLLQPVDATVTDSAFFKYTIEDVSDLDNLHLLLNVSKKRDL